MINATFTNKRNREVTVHYEIGNELIWVDKINNIPIITLNQNCKAVDYCCENGFDFFEYAAGLEQYKQETKYEFINQ